MTNTTSRKTIRVLKHHLRNVDKFDFYSSELPNTFKSHLSGLNDKSSRALLDLRTFVMGLGKTVVEQIRPHRIVYAKSLTFRTFLDVRPAVNSLVIEIRKSRHEPIVEHTIRSVEDLQSIKDQIARAYETIE